MRKIGIWILGLRGNLDEIWDEFCGTISKGSILGRLLWVGSLDWGIKSKLKNVCDANEPLELKTISFPEGSEASIGQ